MPLGVSVREFTLKPSQEKNCFKQLFISFV